MDEQIKPINNEQTAVVGERIAPAYQDTVYMVMQMSSRSGGTYSTVRRSKESLERFLDTLERHGADMSKVKVFEQSKPWVPIRKTKKKGLKVDDSNN